MIPSPTNKEIRALRRRSKLTQEEAANLVHLRSSQRWSEYEQGKINMSLARWELFLIKIDGHPDFTKRLSR